jgi:hypothetical protein
MSQANPFHRPNKTLHQSVLSPRFSTWGRRWGAGGKGYSLHPLVARTPSPRLPPVNELLARGQEPLHSGSRSKATLLGWGDGRLEGDMGLSQDGPIGPSQHANPQDSPPVASRHPTRAPNPRNRARLGARFAEHFGDCLGPVGARVDGWDQFQLAATEVAPLLGCADSNLLEGFEAISCK